MQLPTCTGMRIRSLTDAHVIFHAVSLGLLPIVSRRLDIEERRYIHSGCVCVWEERSAGSEGSSVRPSLSHPSVLHTRLCDRAARMRPVVQPLNLR